MRVRRAPDRAASGLARQQVQFPRPAQRVGPGVRSELGEELAKVIAHAVLRQAQLGGNLLAGPAAASPAPRTYSSISSAAPSAASAPSLTSLRSMTAPLAAG